MKVIKLEEATKIIPPISYEELKEIKEKEELTEW